MKKMNNTTVLVVVLIFLSAAAAAVAEEGGCTEEVTSFSSCLAYVANPPNNLTDIASEKCCKAFALSVESLCVCYLIREPMMLGFPLNTTKIQSLSSLCPSQTSVSSSLSFLCSVSPSLPPLNSATTTVDQAIATAPAPESSIGRRVPRVTGNGGSNNGQTLNTFLLFQFLSTIVTLFKLYIS